MVEPRRLTISGFGPKGPRGRRRISELHSRQNDPGADRGGAETGAGVETEMGTVMTPHRLAKAQELSSLHKWADSGLLARADEVIE